MSFPYSYFSCPCADTSATTAAPGGEVDDEAEEEKTFDPRSPRTNFSLYPLDHLLWCEDCHEIRCARCTIEEIVCWYCPSCLFEVASSMVKSEGNRCTRNCFNCPICTAPTSVNTLDTEIGGGPWILACEYCNWTSLDIGIEFQRSNNIFGQLLKLQHGGTSQTPLKRPTSLELSIDAPRSRDINSRFATLKSFYTSQLAKTSSTNPLMSPSGEINYNSPSSLARIMSLYTGQGSYGKKSTGKPGPMRESADVSEGLQVLDLASEEAEIAKLCDTGWRGTTSIAQQTEQKHSPRFTNDLHPIPTLLRTKRSKRCRTCKHILAKPEAKIQSTRYKIKLAALNYVPNLTLIPLSAPSSPATLDLTALPSSRPLQFLLTLKNPLFDPVKVTLATLSQTPGCFSSKVTILCPQFDIGANTDVWDEALEKAPSSASAPNRHKKPNPTHPSVDPTEARVAEAGKIWEKGRNWTTIVLEIICASINSTNDQKEEEIEIEEDEDVLEIPIFVRVEYEADVAGDERGKDGGGGEERREKREVAFWCVLGVGRIAKGEEGVRG